MVQKKKIFEYFLCISMVQTQGPLAWGHFMPRGRHLNTVGKGPLGHATYPCSFNHLSPVILKKKILNICLCISMIQTQDPLPWSHFRPRGHHLNKLVKGSLGHATFQSSNTWAQWLWRRRFGMFSVVQTQDPLGQYHFGPGATIWTNLVKGH